MNKTIHLFRFVYRIYRCSADNDFLCQESRTKRKLYGLKYRTRYYRNSLNILRLRSHTRSILFNSFLRKRRVTLCQASSDIRVHRRYLPVTCAKIAIIYLNITNLRELDLSVSRPFGTEASNVHRSFFFLSLPFFQTPSNFQDFMKFEEELYYLLDSAPFLIEN